MCVCLSVWLGGLCGFYVKVRAVTLKENREPHSHHLIASVFQQVMSCRPCCSIIALVFLDLCFLSVSSARHAPQHFSGSFPSMSCDISAPSHSKTYLHSHALGTVSYCLSVCMSPHSHGRLFCVVHWLLFCHYMLQIGGFVFYEDVCTGDGQVKHCNSLLVQRNMQDPLSCPQLPSLTFAPLLPLY